MKVRKGSLGTQNYLCLDCDRIELYGGWALASSSGRGTTGGGGGQSCCCLLGDEVQGFFGVFLSFFFSPRGISGYDQRGQKDIRAQREKEKKRKRNNKKKKVSLSMLATEGAIFLSQADGDEELFSRES